MNKQITKTIIGGVAVLAVWNYMAKPFLDRILKKDNSNDS